MAENFSIFDFMGAEGEKYKPLKATDWRWTMADDYPKEKNGLKVFSCFACGGGSTMGYKLAGCDVLGCVEIDPRMNEVYKANHNPKFNFCMDIREFNNIPNEELPTELFNLDILDGSPPCTTFSMAGDREDSWGKKKKFREGQAEQTLDDLSFIFIDTVEKLKPKCVVMENVEGLIRGEAWAYVQRIYAHFKEIGYTVKHWLLKGEHMGIPQARHRVFFVTVRNDVAFDVHHLDMAFNYEPIFFGEVKEGVGESAACYDILKKAQPGDRALCDVLLREEGRYSRFNETIVWNDKICPTIHNHGFYRGEEKTKCSEEDYRNCSTFPRDYDWCGQSASYICGMSVPPVMMKRVVTRLIESGLFK
jgi:DNA (cytosine-5)-methyltransferase 1